MNLYILLHHQLIAYSYKCHSEQTEDMLMSANSRIIIATPLAEVITTELLLTLILNLS